MPPIKVGKGVVVEMGTSESSTGQFCRGVTYKIDCPVTRGMNNFLTRNLHAYFIYP